jgi:hypothetical protein
LVIAHQVEFAATQRVLAHLTQAALRGSRAIQALALGVTDFGVADFGGEDFASPSRTSILQEGDEN